MVRESDPPLVSICIPTFNRAGTLARALDSALAQSVAPLEIVVSDNASDDASEEIARSYARADPRVRYVRQPRNIGPTANFNFLFAAARGEYVQMLADDDWLEDEYVSTCLAELRGRPDHVLVGGRARYYADGRLVSTGVELQLDQPRGADRVLAYYRQVQDNATFYGLMRTAALRRAAPLRNTLGNDWLLMAGVAWQGRVAMLDAVTVHRDAGGTSAELGRIVRTFGGGRVQQRLPHLAVSATVAADIAWRGEVYRELDRRERATLALRCSLAAMDWSAQAWYLTEPLAAALGRRRALRPLAEGYARMTDALVARRRRGRAAERDYFDPGGPHP